MRTARVGGAVSAAGLEASMAGDVGQFASHVVQLKVLSPNGKKFVVSEKTKTLLALMRLSYGLLGVVYEVTLRVRPGARLLRANGEGVVQGLRPARPEAARRNGRREALSAAVPRSHLPRAAPAGRRSRSGAQVRLAAQGLGRVHGAARSGALARQGDADSPDSLSADRQLERGCAIAREQCARPQRQQFGRAERALPDARQQEPLHVHDVGFPASEFANTALAYKLFCKEYYARTGFRCDMPTVGFRLNRDRSALLSPSFDSPMFTLSPLSTQVDGWDDFVLDFADFAAKHHGMPFFNQTRNAAPGSRRAALRHAAAFFNKVRRELDPYDRLVNQFFQSYLPQAPISARRLRRDGYGRAHGELRREIKPRLSTPRSAHARPSAI